MKVIWRRRSWLRRQSKYKMGQPLPSLSLNCYWSIFGNDLFKLLILAFALFFFITVLNYISIFLGLVLNSLYLDHGLDYFSAYVWRKTPAALFPGNSSLPSSFVSNILSFTLRIPSVFCNLLLLGERMHCDFNLRSLPQAPAFIACYGDPGTIGRLWNLLELGPLLTVLLALTYYNTLYFLVLRDANIL